MPPRPLRPSLFILLTLTLASPALAQPGGAGEYRMDQSGNWVQVAAPQPGTDESVMAQARRELAQDRPADAARTIGEWIDKNERTTNAYLAQALIIRADALTAQGDEYDALYDYERAIKEFPATQSFITGVERELDIGVRYVNGLRRKFFGARVLPVTDIGEELLIRVQERTPGSRVAERAGIELADFYYREHELSLAVEAYDLFLQNYPNSNYKQRAMQRRIYATIARFKGPKYDGSSLIDAKILTRKYASMYPAEAQKAGLDDGLLTRLDESSGQEMLETASWYLKRKDEVSARLVLRRLVRDHSKTAAAQKALDIIKEHGWTMQPGPERKPAPKEADFESGVPGGIIDSTTGKPIDESKPDKKPDAAPASPDARPPPVELNRRKPVIPPNPNPTPSDPNPPVPPSNEPRQP